MPHASCLMPHAGRRRPRARVDLSPTFLGPTFACLCPKLSVGGTKARMLKHNGKYDVLGVAATADAKAIRAAFLQLAKVHHPDKGGDPVKFNRINEAYLTLNDPVLREKHDSSLFGLAVFEHRAPAPAPAPPTPQEVAEIPEMAGCPSSRLANAGQRFEELLAHMRRMHLLSVGDRLGVWFAEFRKAIESMLGTSARWRTEYATRLLELLQSWHDLYLRSEYREAAMQECARLLRDLMARTRFPAAQDERERESCPRRSSPGSSSGRWPSYSRAHVDACPPRSPRGSARSPVRCHPRGKRTGQGTPGSSVSSEERGHSRRCPFAPRPSHPRRRSPSTTGRAVHLVDDLLEQTALHPMDMGMPNKQGAVSLSTVRLFLKDLFLCSRSRPRTSRGARLRRWRL